MDYRVLNCDSKSSRRHLHPSVGWLLVSSAIVLQPARLMSATWIMMRPMNDTSFCVPLIFPVEHDRITFSESGKSGCEINVVGNKQGLTGMEFQYKSLMAASLVIIC